MAVLERIRGRQRAAGDLSEAFRASVVAEADRLGDRWIGPVLRQVAADVWTGEQLAAFTRIELAREVAARSEVHLGEPYGADKTIGQMARRASKAGDRARLLTALVMHQRPTVALELGTCCGVSAAYQATGLGPGAGLTTLELSPLLVGTARLVLGLAGVADRVTVVIGDFADTLNAALDAAPQYVFIDGKHEYEATVDYFRRMVKACPPGALLVFDDVDWSDGMRRAWAEIRADGAVAHGAQLSNTGIIALG